jgi:hypothetical protein
MGCDCVVSLFRVFVIGVANRLFSRAVFRWRAPIGSGVDSAPLTVAAKAALGQ